MNARFKISIMFAAITAVSPLISTSLSAQTSAQPDAEQRIGTMEKRRIQQTEYVNAVAAAFQSEKRSDSWAAQKESEISISYEAAKDAPHGALKSVECRSSKCELQLQVSEESADAAVKQHVAIEQWIAGSQSCGY